MFWDGSTCCVYIKHEFMSPTECSIIGRKEASFYGFTVTVRVTRVRANVRGEVRFIFSDKVRTGFPDMESVVFYVGNPTYSHNIVI